MTRKEEVSTKIVRLTTKRDNIIYALVHHELSHEKTLQLETQLSAVEDDLVLLFANEAA